MPAMPMFSRKLYDKLGDEAATELADWLVRFHHDSRSELRELFAHQQVLMDARFSQFAAEIRGEFDSKLAQQTASLKEAISDLRSETREALAEMRVDSATREKTLIRWMFMFWIGSWAAMVGTLIALRQLGWLGGP